MTNAEKFLKDDVSVREFRNKLTEFFWDKLGLYEGNEEQIYTIIGDFLNNIEQPTLTEDERVILRNIPKEYTKIRRNDWKEIEFVKENRAYRSCYLLSHLFQFIKERRRIRNKRIVRR